MTPNDPEATPRQKPTYDDFLRLMGIRHTDLGARYRATHVRALYTQWNGRMPLPPPPPPLPATVAAGIGAARAIAR